MLNSIRIEKVKRDYGKYYNETWEQDVVKANQFIQDPSKNIQKLEEKRSTSLFNFTPKQLKKYGYL